jgi:RPA family protein
VFAAELLHPGAVADTSKSSAHILYTPGGVACRVLFSCGVLTEFSEKGEYLLARLADPTGAVTLRMGRQDQVAREACEALEPPAFVTCSGRVEIMGPGPGIQVSIRPFYLYPANRGIRDVWIGKTAEITLSRLSAMEAAIQSGRPGSFEEGQVLRIVRPSLHDLADIAKAALAALDLVRAQPAAAIPDIDLRSAVLGTVADLSGPKGVPVEELLHHFAGKGLPDSAVIDVVRGLIADDELYQPQKGYVKIL